VRGVVVGQDSRSKDGVMKTGKEKTQGLPRKDEEATKYEKEGECRSPKKGEEKRVYTMEK